MASIVWRSDRGKWYAYYHRDGKHTGTPLKGAPAKKDLTKQERANAVAEAEAIAEARQPVTVNESDLETAAALWLNNAEAKCSPRTVESYRTKVKLFVLYLAPDRRLVPLRSVSAQDVRSFRDARMKTCAASTVTTDLKCLTALFTWLRRQRLPDGTRWITENPCEDVDYPKRPQRRVEFPTDTEIRKMVGLLDSKGVEFRALGLMGAFAGMRRNEIIMLRWDQIDLASGLLYVSGKSKWPRPVPIHPRVRALLEALPRVDPMVLPSSYGLTKQRSNPFASWQFNNWLRGLGFKWTHHGLRRWFNDRLRRITTLSDAARRLVVGHEDEATNRLYQNPQAEEARPFVEALEP